jgi:hypothetical protein
MWSRIVLACLLLTGCSAGDPDVDVDVEDEPEVGSTQQAFTRAQAKLAGRALAAGIEEAAQRYDPIAPAAMLDAECTTLSGDTTDVDGDGIPASAKLTFDCSKRRLGFTGTLTGVESVSDQQPDAVAWAFDAGVELQSTLTGPFGGSMVVDAYGTVLASQQGVAGPFELAVGLDVESLITNVRGIETEILEDIEWTVSYAPELAWAPGDLAVVGKLSTDGVWNVSVNDISAVATLRTPTALSFEASCETRVTAGLVEASLAFGERAATIAVEWSGCGQPVVSYDLSAPPSEGM